MRIRKTGYIVWDKNEQTVFQNKGMFVFDSKRTAWLAAGKERKGSPYKVVSIAITVKK